MSYKIWHYILAFLFISALIGCFFWFLPTPAMEFLYSPISSYLTKYPDLMKVFELILRRDNVGYFALIFLSISSGFFLTVFLGGIFGVMKSSISELVYRRKKNLLTRGE